ncbi:DNA-binding protein [Thermofilum pendens]|uniref:DNA-binding protein Tpen_0471 n=1 Tax=Thermofilum pendens (strain DSM 2475 / Hrk 5) TaxID=368408 RepID=Y471_THEPD|nr:RecName: Full=DNA-binding protein Tpen_0471 [Thermofilum pendens Hrk 5]ABL77880.1 DNA-binding TFAR19-related protein [Thermofilum pendens Hrk 5]
MSYDEGGEELEEIKRRKLLEYQRALEAEKAKEEQKAREEAMRQEILRRILTPEARARLSNLKLVKPELVEALEIQLIQLAESRSVRVPIDDETLKQILARLYEAQRAREVKFRVSF